MLEELYCLIRGVFEPTECQRTYKRNHDDELLRYKQKFLAWEEFQEKS